MADYRIPGPLEVSADGHVIEICCRKTSAASRPMGSISTPRQLLRLRASALRTAVGNVWIPTGPMICWAWLCPAYPWPGFRPYRQPRRSGNARGRGQLTPFLGAAAAGVESAAGQYGVMPGGRRA